VLPVAAAIPAVNLVISLAIVLLPVRHHLCVVAVVDMVVAFEADLLAPTAQRPATSVVDQIIMLGTVKLRQ
jgi:hypothetical protein